jgi:hypothetical protein
MPSTINYDGSKDRFTISVSRQLAARSATSRDAGAVATTIYEKFKIAAQEAGIIEPLSKSDGFGPSKGMIPHGWDRLNFVGYLNGRVWVTASRNGDVSICVFNLTEEERKAMTVPCEICMEIALNPQRKNTTSLLREFKTK